MKKFKAAARPVIAVILPVFMIQILSCASSYHPLKPDKSEVIKTPSGDIEVSIDPNILEENGRYFSKAQKKNLAVMGIVLRNRSDKSLVVENEAVDLVLNENKTAEHLKPEVAVELNKLGETGYVLWALLWGEVNGLFIPIGAIIGIGNIAKAKKANKKMEIDYSTKYIDRVVLKPNENVDGLLFYYVDKASIAKGSEWKMSIRLHEADSNEDIDIEIPFSNKEYITRQR